MAKRKPASPSLYKTDLTGYDMAFYMEAIREPSWEKRPLKFPFVEDRDAANVDFGSDLERRNYYGEVPFPGPREGQGKLYGKYTTRPSFDYSSGPNRYINRASQFLLPDNVVATTSGLVELPDGTIHPDWFAAPIGNFDYISGDVTNLSSGPQEHIMGRYPARLSRFDGRPDNEYYPVHDTGDRIPRLFYSNNMNPSYQAPVYPNTRFSSRGIPTKWGNTMSGPRDRNRKR